MPNAWVRFFESRDLKFHLGLALALGFIFRTLAAYFAFGPLAIDDFVDGVYPAIQLSKGEWPEINMGRSYLIVWILSLFCKASSALGFSQGVDLVRAMYFGLGLLSLTAVLGAYFYARASQDRVFGALLIYLSSLYFLMPFLGTRAFGETVSMGIVFLGVGLLQNSRALLLAWLLIGAACFFRFQNGLIYASCLLYYLFQKDWRKVGVGFFAGILTIIAQATIDKLSYGTPFASFLGHLWLNRHGGFEYGAQPWYVFAGTLLGVTFFPFSVLLLPRAASAIRSYLLPSILVGVFALAHSFVPHKEERYMSPILPFVLLLLAAAWSSSRNSKWAKRGYSLAFAVLNFPLLWIACLSNTQGPLISPVVDVQSKYPAGVFVETNTGLSGSFFTTHIYLNPSFSFLKNPTVTLPWIQTFLARAPADQALTVLAAPEGPGFDLLKELDGFQGPEIQCSNQQTGASLTDVMLYYLNPTRNSRRRPIYYVVCRR